ncbi:hypothetical protein DCAR_0205607 [Daucus carota subsp. sativus]|uniref:Uncharacterized protein n=1 Tax=Daucus carota subsp. sativus TaxID=79200 RepID=A0A164VIN7_DAUCS|nr:hypothetical protein DCAR_0205607 [Daucus carota subsp. sativus]
MVTEANLIKIGLLPTEVGTKVSWKKFVDGCAVGEKTKGAKRRRPESSASENDHEDEMTRPSFLRKKPAIQQQAQGAPSSSKPAHEKAAASSLTRTVPDAPEVPSDQPLKRKRIQWRDAPCLNQVARHFADIGDTHVTEEELSKWRLKPQEDKDSFILKSTSELLVHLHDREERRLVDAASTKKTEETLSG